METVQLEEIEKIILNKYLSSVYQPIVSLKDGTVHAYEALSRITETGTSLTIARLFEEAGKNGYLWDLEKICRTNALKNAANKPKNVKLFINIDGNVLRDSKFQKGFTKETLNRFSLDIKDIVFEITERSNFDDAQFMAEITNHYRNQGFEVALDDLGSGYSGLNRLWHIKPSYVKLDYELIHDIHKDKSKKSLVRLLVGHCNDMDYKLIAEGIETEDELKCLIGLGVEYGQGFMLGKPKTSFEKPNKSVARLICELQKNKSDKKNRVGCIGKMGVVLYPTSSIEHAKSVFDNNEKLDYIGIVDSQCKFYGIVDRNTVLKSALERQQLDRTVEDIMKTNVLQIDADKSIKNAVGKLMYRNESEFYEPFIILRKECYYGIATVKDLLVAIGKEL